MRARCFNPLVVALALAAAGYSVWNYQNLARHKERNRELPVAISRGQTGRAVELLNEGADPNARAPLDSVSGYDQRANLPSLPHVDQRGPTVLHLAASHSQAALASALLAHGADPNSRDNAGFTPLILAAEEGATDVVAALLKSGAEVNAVNNSGRTALMQAAPRADLQVAQILLDHSADVNVVDKMGCTALEYAVKRANPALTDLLLHHHALVNTLDRNGQSPLLAAAELGRTPALAFLLRAGADPNMTARGGDSALAAAARRSDLPETRLLLDHGARTETLDPGGRTPLLDAAAALCGTDNNVPRKVTRSLVAYTVSAPRYEDTLAVVKLLIARKADVNARDSSGVSVVDWAAQAANGHAREAVELTERAGARLDPESQSACDAMVNDCDLGHIEAVRFLLARGVSPDAHLKTAQTALGAAAYTGHLDVVRLLVKAGANVDFVYPAGDQSALMDAVNWDQIDVVKELIGDGADVSYRTRGGQTALGLALHAHPALVALLRNAMGLAGGAKTADAGAPAAEGPLHGQGLPGH